MLRGLSWLLITDVSGLPIGPIVNGQTAANLRRLTSRKKVIVGETVARLDIINHKRKPSLLQTARTISLQFRCAVCLHV